jgi:Phosphoglycerol transferase and related proteins, alkaline phosphatase superfamily
MGVLLISLLLPVWRMESLYYPNYHLKFGDSAELDNLGLIYKSDSRGAYVILDGNWHIFPTLGKQGSATHRLLTADGKEAGRVDIPINKTSGYSPECAADVHGCPIHISGTIRVPKDTLTDLYQLTAELHAEDGSVAGTETPRILRQLPPNGFSLFRMALSLLATLLLCGSLLHMLKPTLRQSLWHRALGCLLLGNLAFVILHGSFSFRFSEFLVWSEYRIAQYYLSQALMILGWTLSVLIGRHLYMGLLYTCLFAIGLLANIAKLSIYGIPLGGDDLANLGSLLQIVVEQHPVVIWSLLIAGTGIIWRLQLVGWLLRSSAVLIAFFGFSVFATQASLKVLGPNINYFNNETLYHREMIWRGPALYLFDLISELVEGKSIFAYPLPAISPLQDEPPQPTAQSRTPPLFDVIVVMQYEALWLGWQGGICKPAPTLDLPDTVQRYHNEIHSPTTGGMTVLAEFEMNTGLPVGLLKKGIVPYYYLSEKTPGLARTALDLGYQTTFVHPYKRGFWGREKAIPALGYQLQLFEEHFSPLQQKGLYTSDHAVIETVLEQIDKASAPQFIYAVTMQGHGPFNQQRYGSQQLSAACPGLNKTDSENLDTYYTGVVDEMASLQWLVSELEKSGKRYLVLAFGDHQPYLMGAGKLVLPPKAKTEMTFRIPFMAFTHQGGVDLQRYYQAVQQLFQANQQTIALMQGIPPQQFEGVLHPVLGMDNGFELQNYSKQITRSFKPEQLTSHTPH